MNKSLQTGLAVVALACSSLPSYAAAPPAIRESVAVCDVNAPSHCTAPNTDGSVNVKVTGGSGGSITTVPGAVTSTDASFTVTLGGTYQTVLAASGTRKGCTFQNPTTATEAVSFKFGSQATAYTIAPGAGISCDLPNGLVDQSAITATAATTSHAVSGTSQ